MSTNLQPIKNRYGIIGRSEKLDRALSTAVRVAPTNLSVLITGESGVGKEVFSKIIHNLSPRKHNDFIAINTGAIPEGTINSELFGHEKGAFTGATNERKGYFETVDQGTIFMDEIGEMPLDTQAYLLRVLETGEFIRVGSSKVLKTDVRVIAATNVDLEQKIKEGKFREDLYYRLSTVPIHVPSLKERREDIYTLFRKFSVDFAEKYKSSPVELDHESRQIFEMYSWPGNIRELKNVTEQLSILSEDQLISKKDLSDLMPKVLSRHLPQRINGNNDSGFEEREILYKVLFDMKSDLNDMKGLIHELVKQNDLKMPERAKFDTALRIPEKVDFPFEYSHKSDSSLESVHNENIPYESTRPEIVDNEKYEELEIVDENLSLEAMEKEYIQKALERYKGRRKEAAKELGISERTLYRKILYYDL